MKVKTYYKSEEVIDNIVWKKHFSSEIIRRLHKTQIYVDFLKDLNMYDVCPLILDKADMIEVVMEKLLCTEDFVSCEMVINAYVTGMKDYTIPFREVLIADKENTDRLPRTFGNELLFIEQYYDYITPCQKETFSL